MDEDIHVDETSETSESSSDSTKLSRRGVLAGTAGLAFLPRYNSANASSTNAISTDSNAPIQIGSRLELFVDDYLIESVDGVRSQYHHPEPEEVVIEHDEPWEGGFSIYHSTFKDEDHPYDYRMYYRAVGPESANQTAYAESDDGIEWEKPNLTGDDTNVVRGLGRDVAVFKDENPDAPEDERYKAIGVANGGLSGYVSPDGFDWSPVENNPIITQGAFDSHNTAIWDSTNEEYRSFSRAFDGGQRIIQTCTSQDFRNWTDPVPLDYPEAPAEQLYINAIEPYPRAPHLWLGFPARYIERDPNSQSMRELPGWDLRESLLKKGRQGYALTDMLFMSSRDGETFSRAPETFLRPGLWEDDAVNNWIYGDNFAAWQIFETPSPDANRPRELSLYATEKYRTGETVSGNGASQLRRYSLRVDGFVSMHAPLTGGEFVTKPFVFDGNELVVNYATSAAGSVRIEIQNPGGDPYEGFSLSESPELFGDDLERAVEYPGADISELANRPVRLRFVMSDADVYSFQFQNVDGGSSGGTVAHYPLDSIQEDGTVADTSGNGNDGLNNGATVVDGVVDKAFEFDGADNIDISNLSVDESVSVACWITSESETTEYVFDGGGHTVVLYLRVDNGQVYPTWWIATEDGNNLARGPSIPVSEWTHVAGTLDGTTLRLYINGELVVTQGVESPPVVASGPSRIGESLSGGFAHHGRTDDFYVFDHALSQEEIDTLVERGENSN